MHDVLCSRMTFFFCFLLLLAAFHPTNAASVTSANARALAVNDRSGAFGFSENHAHDILRRQDNGTTPAAAPPQTTPAAAPTQTTPAAAQTTPQTTAATAQTTQTTAAAPPTTCATISPLCPGTGDCCSGICCATACCTGGTICSGGQCVANNPSPDPNTATTAAATGGTTVAAQTTSTSSIIVNNPTTTSSIDNTVANTTIAVIVATTTAMTPDTTTAIALDTTVAAGVTANVTVQPDITFITPAATSLSSGATTNTAANSDSLNPLVSNGTGTGTAPIPPATTLAIQVSGTTTLAIELSGTDSEDGGATATQTAYLVYNVTTMSDVNGPQYITYGSVTETSAITPTDVGQAGASASPLYVQQVPPTVNNNPNVQMQYQPTDAWVTSGSAAGSDNGGSAPGNNSTSAVTSPISLCNNGTKISNQVGSTIKLQFIGTEASLLIVPSFRGAKYEIKFDDEIPKILNSYKEDGDSCEVSTPWIRTGLDNAPHNVSITIKGDGAGAAGSSGQLEFSGLIFKGPQQKSSSGTNKWIIVGVSIGALLIVVALVVLLVMCIRKRRVQSSTSQDVAPPPHSRQSTQPIAPNLYTPSHMRVDSNLSSGQPSLPSSPQMSYRTSFAPGQPNPGSPGMHSRTISGGSPSMHARNTSWVEGGGLHARNTSRAEGGGLPPGAGYAPYPVSQPVGGGNNAPTVPFSIPVSVTYSSDRNGDGTVRHSFAQGHARTGSNPSINRNPFE